MLHNIIAFRHINYVIMMSLITLFLSISFWSTAAYACSPVYVPPRPEPPDLSWLADEDEAAYRKRVKPLMEAYTQENKAYDDARAKEREDNRNYWIDTEEKWLAESQVVAIVTLKKVKHKKDRMLKSTFRSGSVLKGQLKTKRFRLETNPYGPCGSSQYGVKSSSQIGEDYIVFAKSGNLRADNTIITMKPLANILSPVILESVRRSEAANLPRIK